MLSRLASFGADFTVRTITMETVRLNIISIALGKSQGNKKGKD